MPDKEAAVPLASVVIFTRNRSGYLRLQLAAALAQTEQDIEVLVMDNGSTDNTTAAVASFQDVRIRYVRHPFNRGPAKNYQLAMKRVRGKYVLLAHDDDVIHPDLVHREIEILRAHPGAVAAFANASLIDEHGRCTQPRLIPMEEDRCFPPGVYIEAWLRQSLWLPFPSMMLRRPWPPKLFTEKRWYGMGSLADIALACHLNRTASLVLLADPLFQYRQHSQQANRQKDSTCWAVRMHHRMVSYLRMDPRLRRLWPEARAVLLRYRAQRRLLRATEPLANAKRLHQDLSGLFARHRRRKAPPIWHIGFAQMALLARFLELGSPSGFVEPPPEDAFGRWLQAARLAGGMAEALRARGYGRVAIFGSMLNAFLLAADLRHGGIEVCCFLDSNEKRQERPLAGLLIHPPAWISEHAHEVDVVLLSSERPHQEALVRMLQGQLPADRKELPVLPWQELV